MFIGLLRIAVRVVAVVSGTRAWLKIEGNHGFPRVLRVNSSTWRYLRSRVASPVLLHAWCKKQWLKSSFSIIFFSSRDSSIVLTKFTREINLIHRLSNFIVLLSSRIFKERTFRKTRMIASLGQVYYYNDAPGSRFTRWMRNVSSKEGTRRDKFTLWMNDFILTNYSRSINYCMAKYFDTRVRCFETFLFFLFSHGK